MPGKSKEEYLEAIYGLLEDARQTKTGEIARELKVKESSVSEMLKKLDEEGFIKHRPYYGVELTKKGLTIGAKVKRKHRLLERFLHDVLKIRKRDIHEQACQMEHTLSDEAADALDRFMDHPRDCPDDGKPIPPADEARIINTLDQLRPADKAEVEGLAGGSSFQSRMKSMGIMKGKKIRVVAKEPLGGPIVIKVGNTKVTIGRGMAGKIRVVK
jgi:DtxR family Mn-dependent transcriptional regulator